LALLFLYFYPAQYKTLFLFAFVPGLIAVLITFLLKEKKTEQLKKSAPPFHETFGYWKKANQSYKELIAALLLFALVNSSDMFLLLKMKEAGVADTMLIGVYIFYNLVFALFAFPLGKLADKLGMKFIFCAGLFLYVVTYFGFAFSSSVALFLVFFFTYGLFAAATEGVAKAWISKLVPSNENASAVGFYTGFQSIAAFIASSAAGLIWLYGEPQLVFITAGLIAFFVMLRLLRSSLS